MPQINVGARIRPRHTSYADYERAWLRADDLGAASLGNWDRFFPLSGDPHGPHFEGWTTLAAIGPRIRRATVGCLVLVARQPVTVAPHGHAENCHAAASQAMLPLYS